MKLTERVLEEAGITIKSGIVHAIVEEAMKERQTERDTIQEMAGSARTTTPEVS